jgi:hypothetical protein
VEYFMSFLGLIAFAFIVTALRGFTAQKRIQAYIDNGKVLYTGGCIEIAPNLPDSEVVKLQIERDIYIKTSRTMTGLFKLYRKNSQYL